jgi:CRP-like cAMP-binding protein
MEEWLSAPGASPEARRAIEALDPAARDLLDRGLEPMDLHAGATLFANGDPRDAAFLILAGHILLTGDSPQGRVLAAGEGVGEIGLAARGPHTTTARALDECRVLRLGRIAFEGLCERYPEAMSRLAEFITPVAYETLLARVLCDLLGERDATQLASLLAEVETVELKRGAVLYRQGQESDCMFVVIYGRLRMVAKDPGGTETVVDEVGCGDTVGWKSLMTGGVRSTTVYALRDSAVGAISRPVFETLTRQYPEVIMRLSRIALRRARHRTAAPGIFRASNALSLAVVPAGAPRGAIPLAAFAGRLASAVAASGTTLHLSSAAVAARLGRPGIAEVDAGDPAEPRAGCLAAGAGAKSRLRDLRSRRRLDAVDRALPAHGRSGAAGGPWRVRSGAHRAGRTARPPRRLDHDGVGAAPAR